MTTQHEIQKPEISLQVLDLADGVGQFIEYWGFKKIHGRIWALIFLADRPVDASYLMQQLNVSKSLISMSLKDLLDYRVILETSPKRTTVHYESNSDMSAVIADVLLSREAKMLLSIKSRCELVGLLPAEKIAPYASQARVKKLSQMVSVADKVLKTLILFKRLNLKHLRDSLNLKNNKKEKSYVSSKAN